MNKLLTRPLTRIIVLGVLAVLACGVPFVLAAWLDADTAVEDLYDHALHNRLVERQATNLQDLATRFMDDQYFYLWITPPDPDFILNQSGGIVPILDDNAFPSSFLDKLTEMEQAGIPRFPVWVSEAKNGNIIVESLQGQRLATIHREPGYSPDWLARAIHPEFDTYEKSYQQWLVEVYSPQRVRMQYDLILGQDNLIQVVLQQSLSQAQAVPQGGGMAMMRSAAGVSNLQFIGIEKTSGGLLELTIAWPTNGLSTNMVDFFACTNLMVQDWQIAATTNVDLNTNTFAWIDPASTNHGIRFYDCWDLGDSDFDGLSDGREHRLHDTAPDNPDTDDDGMPDGWELENSLDPLDDSDAAPDDDMDGLSNLQEYWNGTNPSDDDTDDDAIPDGWEVGNGTDPLTNDASSDPDSDGLANLAEYQNGTDPRDGDTDDDGLPDGWEVSNGTAPLTPDAGQDPDDDGLSNIEEYRIDTDPDDDDSDNDGLSDGEEVNTYGTDPLDQDSDSDGIGDYEELNVFRSDPTQAGDLPEQYAEASQTVYYGHPSPSATNFIYSFSSALYDKVTMGKGWITNDLFVPDLGESSDTVYYGQPDHNDCPDVFVHSRTSTMWNDVRMGDGWIIHGGFITDYTQPVTTVYYGKPDESGHNDLFVYGTHAIDMDDEVEMGKGWVKAGGFEPDLTEPSDQIYYTRPDNINNPTNWVYTYDFRAGGWYDIGDGWLRANSPPTYIPDLTKSSAIVYYGLPGTAGTSDRFVCSYSIDMRDDVFLAKGWATPHGVLADLDSTAWPIYYGNIDGHPDKFVFSRTTIGMSNWAYIGQGWVNMQDYVLNSEASPDENGDGQMDGYDPMADAGQYQSPDDSHATELLLTVGDTSGSHTEMYAIHVGDHALVMPHVNSNEYLFSSTQCVQRGVYIEDAYLESLSDPDDDGDYHAAVSGSGIYVDDYDSVLGTHEDTGFNSGNRYFDVYVPKVDILAHRPGTRSSPGSAVSKVHENMPGDLVARVNSDNDDGGPSGDHDYDDTYIGSSDDDIVKLTLNEILPDELDEGTLVLTVEPTNTAVRIFKSAATVLDDYELDLSSPSGNDLAGVLSGDLDLYVEILEWHDEITIKLAYKAPGGAEICADRVRIAATPRPDIDLDAENDGDIDEADDPIENVLPGKVVWADKDAYWREGVIDSQVVAVNLDCGTLSGTVPEGAFVLLQWIDVPASGRSEVKIFEDTNGTNEIETGQWHDTYRWKPTLGRLYTSGEALPSNVYVGASEWALDPGSTHTARTDTVVHDTISLICYRTDDHEELARDDVKVTIANTPAVSPKGKDFWIWEEEYTHGTNYHSLMEAVWEAVDDDTAGMTNHTVPYDVEYFRESRTNVTAANFANLGEAAILLTAHHGGCLGGYVYPVAFSPTPVGESNAIAWAEALGSDWAESLDFGDHHSVKVKTTYFRSYWKSERDANDAMFFTTACSAGRSNEFASLPSFVESVGGEFACGYRGSGEPVDTTGAYRYVLAAMRKWKWRTAFAAFEVGDLAGDGDGYAMAGDGKVTLWPAPLRGSYRAVYPQQHCGEEGTALALFDTALALESSPLEKVSGDADMTGTIPAWLQYDGDYCGLRWPYTDDASPSIMTEMKAVAEECYTPWTGVENTGKQLAADGESCGMDLHWEF